MVKFRDIDLFGTKFELKLDGEEKYKSKIGAICSLIYIISIVLIGSLCVKDFFDTKNLNVSYTLKEKINANGEAKNSTLLNNSNFFLAFQIYDFDLQPVLSSNENKVIYPFPVYIRSRVDPNTGEWTYENKRLKIKNCTEENFGDTLEYSYLLNYLCIDFEELYIGGGWSELYNDYFTIAFKSCDILNLSETDEIFYALLNNNTNCSSDDDFVNTIKDAYIDMFVPGYKLNLNINNKTALSRHQSNIYDLLDRYQYKNTDFYMQETTFKDDHGYFVDSPYSTDSESVLSIGNKIDMTSINMPRKQEQLIYKLNINYSSTEYIIERRQTRIQDLIANLMGIVEIIQIIFGSIAEFYNSSMLNISIINKVFNFCEHEEDVVEDTNKNYKNINKNDSSKRLQELNVNAFHKMNSDRITVFNDIEDVNIGQDRNIEYNIIEFKSKLQETNIIALGRDLNNSINANANDYANNSKPKTKHYSYEDYLTKLEKEKKSMHINKLDLNFFQLTNLCCYKKSKHNATKILNAYELCLKYIEERTDIMYLLDTYKQIEIGKSLFLTDPISFIFNSLKKQNILSKKGYEFIKKHVKEFDKEKIDETNNIKDTNKIIYDKLISINEYLSKVKQYEVDNMNLEGHLSHKNLVKLVKEINPIYKDVLLSNTE